MFRRGFFLNVDGGELDDEPAELYALAHLVHLACGGHAGDLTSMRRVIRACAAAGTAIGAHPSYPDRLHFGRRSRKLEMTAREVEAAVRAQCVALADVAAELSVPVASVKPHGALYHDAAAGPELARAVVNGIVTALGSQVQLVGPPRGHLHDCAAAAGLRYAREGFADRNTLPDGSLVPRGHPGALIDDPMLAAARAEALRRQGAVDTVCVHGDTPRAVEIATAVRGVLDGHA